MRKIKIGVIAGTPVDTQMGVNFIKQKGFEAVGISTASNPKEQNILQYLHPDLLTIKVLEAIGAFEAQGIYNTMIYCNSLSAAIKVEDLRSQNKNSTLITPLDIYKRLALRLDRLLLWAANAQCLAAIEQIFYDKNPYLEIIGFSMLPVVNAIERGEPPEIIITRYKLQNLCLEMSRCQGLVLGCTHFPYLKGELEAITSMDIIDPAEEMLKQMVN